MPGTILTFTDDTGNHAEGFDIEAPDYGSAASLLLDWLEREISFTSVLAVGHRVVHGMNHAETERVDEPLLEELHAISSLDPDHLPGEIELIEAFRRRHPRLPQVACFDTAFHRSMPRVAKLLPIPRRFDAMGIRRYGFHGLSYSYLMEELVRVAGDEAANGRVILAHLGNGASLTAVRNGKSADTSMGFTPAGGVPMGTRPGDIDPGVAWYMMRSENTTPERFNAVINHESGLLGVSETSSDMRDLIERQVSDVRATEAVELFCYQVRKWIGAFAAVLGGLDTLVFSGGIGENATEVRARICCDLGFLGVRLDAAKNALNSEVISDDASLTVVRVIRTDEELMIARSVCRLLDEAPQDQRGAICPEEHSNG